MRHILLPLVCAALLAGCSAQDTPEPAESSAVAADPLTDNAAVDGFPVDSPAIVNAWDQECPYLDPQWVAETNGQRMTKQGLDTRFGTPACVFWSYPEAPQATVMVRDLGTVERARAAVDWAAPIDQTEPVDEGGWQGGRGVLNEELSVYAVQKDNEAVLVWTNQAQTVKAELIAKEAIKNLGL
ncbi:hypothetical protein HMPREF3227_02328 [Corynebacterium sp. CMW7794]|uniref:DUF2020 domain-containing protein n=1 Tax=Corynebacterium phoceense TaxID=1686286 RepID=A0A540R8J8_9CORY|nr:MULTISPECIES: DUF2020 domain-containing protein [Corynebacterium]KXI15809.1 hypothetical protein HMPREF3227_02328 [Corynebacterium sp. CMW7794]MCQ9331973.1 DUF2020 domain-containing protein [Corynebacterium phoceense]MCQ9339801.1 DUF2020 domain-containing protein [Corynebacterium phoceense]MCQ9348708.1 DUF2020 domain-containing protein [Corynebacterium phoceense]TQE44056.1 DUF2020 domain-containing protein [Corynebacterium phoceense]